MPHLSMRHFYFSFLLNMPSMIETFSPEGMGAER
jgi:hypothetical protein